MIEWKRYRACQKCRKGKTRCDYDGPESTSCNRCSKLNLECVQSVPVRGGHVPSKAVAFHTGTVGGLGGSSMKSQNALPSLPTNDKSDYQVENLTVKQLARKDCIVLAIELGLYTHESVRLFYDLYMTGMGLLLPLGIEECVAVEVMINTRPLLTLAIVTACAICSTTDHADERIDFLDRVVVERAFVDRSCCFETIQALMVGSFFISINADNISYDRSTSWLNTARQFVEALQMEDIVVREIRKQEEQHPSEELRKPFSSFSSCTGPTTAPSARLIPMSGAYISTNGTDVSKYYSLNSRVQLLMCVNSCIYAASFHSGHPLPKDFFPSWRETADWGMQQADWGVVLSSCVGFVIFVNQNVMRNLIDCKIDNIDELLRIYQAALEEINVVRTNAQSVFIRRLTGVPAKYLDVILTKCDVITTCCQEVVLNRLVANEAKKELQHELAELIKDTSRKTVGHFVEMTKQSARFPKFIYFRPLQAMTSLLRLKVLSLSTGESHIIIDSAIILEQLQICKESWEKLRVTSVIAQYAYEEYFLLVENWVKNTLDSENRIKTRRKATGNQPALSAGALQYLISSIMVTSATPRVVEAAEQMASSEPVESILPPHNANSISEVSKCPTLSKVDVPDSGDSVASFGYSPYEGAAPKSKRAKRGNSNDPFVDFKSYELAGGEFDHTELDQLLQQLFKETTGDFSYWS